MSPFNICLVLLFVAAVSATLTGNNAPNDVPTSCKGYPNKLDVVTDPPVFVSAVKNGKRFVAGKGNDTIHIVHLYGDNAYDYGFAYGQLFASEIKTMYPALLPWLDKRLEMAAKWLPKWLVDIVVKYGAWVGLQYTYDVTFKDSPKQYLDEMNGIAAGAGVDVWYVRNLNMFPQLSRAACTIIGANGQATEQGSAEGSIAHLRALDFDPNAPMVVDSAITVYHTKNTPKVMNFGWLSMVGVLTGFSNTSIGVGEKDWGGPNSPTGAIPYPSEPWMFMLRDVLQLPNMSAVTNHIKTAGNSVAIHVGVGDNDSNEFLGYETAYNYTKVFTWDTHTNMSVHPDMKGLTYWTKNDPARTMCPADMLKSQYGKIDAEWLSMYYSPNDETGDTQVVTFDYKNKLAYVANARKPGSDGPLHAYNRQRTLINMTALFNEPEP